MIFEVMFYVEFDFQDCVVEFCKMVDEVIFLGVLKFKECKILMSVYCDSINGYIYYE